MIQGDIMDLKERFEKLKINTKITIKHEDIFSNTYYQNVRFMGYIKHHGYLNYSPIDGCYVS